MLNLTEIPGRSAIPIISILLDLINRAKLHELADLVQTQCRVKILVLKLYEQAVSGALDRSLHYEGRAADVTFATMPTSCQQPPEAPVRGDPCYALRNCTVRC